MPVLPVNKLSYMKNLKLYIPFLRMGFNCLKVTKPLRGGSLFFTTQSSGVPGTHLINPATMKGSVDLRATQQF